jgi:Arc/MetJ family transcription regulator
MTKITLKANNVSPITLAPVVDVLTTRLIETRTACADAVGKGAVALKDYAAAILAKLGKDILLPKGQETAAVKAEREAYQAMLKDKGITNPSVYWARVKQACAPATEGAGKNEKVAGDAWTKDTVDTIVRRLARDDTNSKLLAILDRAVRDTFKNDQWAKAMFAAADELAKKQN